MLRTLEGLADGMFVDQSNGICMDANALGMLCTNTRNLLLVALLTMVRTLEGLADGVFVDQTNACVV